jgi:DNA-directed RNA polymerase subunit RPC12/RpoP
LQQRTEHQQLNHTKCGGRVFIDRVFSDKTHLELACIECGERWMLDKAKNKLAKWLVAREKNHSAQFAR